MRRPMNERSSVRRLAIARFVSVGGTAATGIALAARVYLRGHTTAWLAVAVLGTPVVVVGLMTPVSGWVADHVDRRLVIVAAELGASVVYVVLAFAQRPPLLIALTAVGSAVNAPLRTALAAGVPNLVSSDDQTWANGLLGGSVSAALIAGPAAGGALVAGAGTGAVFALAAATALLSAAIIARIPGRFSTSWGHGARRPRPGAGFGLIAADRSLVTLVAVSCLASFAVGVVALADLPLARTFGAGSVGYGLLSGAWSAAVIVGARLAAPLAAARGERAALVVGTAAMAVGVGAVAFMPTFSAVIAVGTLGGAGMGLAFAPWFTLLQRRSEDQRRGTIMAAAYSFEQLGIAAGMAAGPAVTTAIGTRDAYLFPAVLLAVVAIVATRLEKTSRPSPLPVARVVEASCSGDESRPRQHRGFQGARATVGRVLR